MNQIDTLFNVKNNTSFSTPDFELQCLHEYGRISYHISVETIYEFASFFDEAVWLLHILEKFTDWMNLHGHSTRTSLNSNDVFEMRGNEFDSIEKAYAWFKLTVNAYVTHIVDGKVIPARINDV